MRTARRAWRAQHSAPELQLVPNGTSAGWGCTDTEISGFLESVGADRDEQGRFLFSWPPGSLGLEIRPGKRGEATRVTIGEDVDYRRHGRWNRLAPALRRATDPPNTLGLWPENDEPTH